MPMFSTPDAFKQSLEQRLRTRAEQTHSDISRLRQILIYERFLARIFQDFGDRALLKGGFALELRLEQARATKDVDLCLRGRPPELLEQLQEASRLNLGDYLTFEVLADSKFPEILAEGLPYKGYRFRVQAFLAGKRYGARYGLDVVLAEPILGQPETLKGSAMMAFAEIEEPTFLVMPLESHIAEKVHAYTMPRERPNSRVKDLPDLALMARIRDFEAAALREALDWTFGKRKMHPVPSELPQPPEFWGPVYERLARFNELPWDTLEEVYRAARRFLDPLLGGSPSRWSSETQSWES